MESRSGTTPTSPAGVRRRGGSAPTRERILRVAVELASLQGLEQLSLATLASAVGMSKSGLFAHFESKEALQLATIEEGFEIFESEVLCDSTGNTNGASFECLERWLSFSERKVFPGGCLFLHQAVEFAHRPGLVRDALAGVVGRQVKAIEECVRTNFQLEGGHSNEARRVAFEIHSIIGNADHLFRVQDDPAVFDHARDAISAMRGAPRNMSHS